MWDLDDDDQFDDNPAGWSFSARGNHRVSLKVTQTNGKTAVKELDIRVNAAPAVAFVWSPLTPVAGQATDLVSIRVTPRACSAAKRGTSMATVNSTTRAGLR